MQPDLELTVSEFVASVNQTFAFAYPAIAITGELANFRVSKGQWVYFDLKDETASVRCFGTVYHLPGVLEDGMLLQVRGTPKLHPLYSFSFNIQSIKPVGEGALKRAADLLAAKLTKEGLFEEARKRSLPYPPARIGLITSAESAAYVDFLKILEKRWNGMDIELIDVVVQGELAPPAIVNAITQFNQQASPPDVLVITRGGGSPEDLWAFNTEQVTRAVAASRIPTLVAIGHEIDISLAELAADRRASTPSNAAEILVPDRRDVLNQLAMGKQQLDRSIVIFFNQMQELLERYKKDLYAHITQLITSVEYSLSAQSRLLSVLDPNAALRRGYAIIRYNNELVRSGKILRNGAAIDISLSDAEVQATVNNVKLLRKKYG